MKLNKFGPNIPIGTANGVPVYPNGTFQILLNELTERTGGVDGSVSADDTAALPVSVAISTPNDASPVSTSANPVDARPV